MTASDALSGPLAPSEPVSGPDLPQAPLSGLDAPAQPEYVLVVPGDPVPWQAAVKMGSAPNAPRKMPGRQEHHAGRIRAAWQELGNGLWLEKGQAVRIVCDFYVTRPKSHYGSGRNERVLKERFRQARPTGRPDLSNLVKMVEDSLTGSAWRDDDQVVRILAVKSYIDWWEQPRSVIRVVPL